MGGKVSLLELEGSISAVVIGDTGELVEVEDDRFSMMADGDSHSQRPSEYVRCFQDHLQAMHLLLRGLDEYRVWWWLVGKAGYCNQVKATQKEIGVGLRLDQPRACRAVQRLIQLGWVERVSRGTLKLSHHALWKGSQREYERACFDEVRRLRG